jgi:hypothetical protein
MSAGQPGRTQAKNDTHNCVVLRRLNFKRVDRSLQRQPYALLLYRRSPSHSAIDGLSIERSTKV